MRPLLLDFFRRSWPMLALVALISLLGAALGWPMVFAPAGMILLLFDAQRGVLRVIRPLPLSDALQARACWIMGVWAVPALALPALAIGTVIHDALHSPAAIASSANGSALAYQMFGARQPAASLWFATALQAWVALGYSALCFILALGLPARPPENASERFGQTIGAALWAISFFGFLFTPLLPKSAAAMSPMLWAICGVVPLLIILSCLVAPAMIQQRLSARGSASKTHERATAIRGGLTGVPLYVTTLLTRTGLFLAFIATAQVLALKWIRHGMTTPPDSSQWVQIVVFAISFGTFGTELLGLRTLRALPLSSVRLAAILSLLPWANGIFCGAFTAIWGRMGDPGAPLWANFAAQALAVGGIGALALTLTLHFISGMRLLLLMVIASVPAALFALFSKRPEVLAMTGAIAGILAFAFLVRGLRRSNRFYQPRHLFGFGLGQPAMR